MPGSWTQWRLQEGEEERAELGVEPRESHPGLHSLSNSATLGKCFNPLGSPVPHLFKMRLF